MGNYSERNKLSKNINKTIQKPEIYPCRLCQNCIPYTLADYVKYMKYEIYPCRYMKYEIYEICKYMKIYCKYMKYEIYPCRLCQNCISLFYLRIFRQNYQCFNQNILTVIVIESRKNWVTVLHLLSFIGGLISTSFRIILIVCG